MKSVDDFTREDWKRWHIEKILDYRFSCKGLSQEEIELTRADWAIERHKHMIRRLQSGEALETIYPALFKGK
jgi:hypothetical protein